MNRARSLFRQYKLIMCSASAVGIGLIAGFGFYARLDHPPLRFEEPEIDLRGSPVVEGDPVEVTARLHNNGKVPLRISNLRTS